MRYPNNAQYRIPDRAGRGGGFQNTRAGNNAAIGRGSFKRASNVRNIGASANTQGVFRNLSKPVVRTFGNRVFRGVGSVVGVSPWGRAIRAADFLISGVGDYNRRPAYDSLGNPRYDVQIYPLGASGGSASGWTFYAGTWNYGGNYAGHPPTRQSPQIYHKDISNQAIPGDPIGSTIPAIQQKVGFWISNWPSSSIVNRWAHHSSYQRTSGEPSQDSGVKLVYSRVLEYSYAPQTFRDVNIWVSPETLPNTVYPFPDALFAIPTSANTGIGISFTTSRGPSPAARAGDRHKSKPPRAGDKEKKLIAAVRGSSALGKGLNWITESVEIVDIIYSSVQHPSRDLQFEAHKRKWALQRLAGEDLRKLSPQEKVKFIYDNFDLVNWDAVIEGLVLNQLEDKFFGAIGKENAKASRRRGSPVGYQFGWAL